MFAASSIGWEMAPRQQRSSRLTVSFDCSKRPAASLKAVTRARIDDRMSRRMGCLQGADDLGCVDISCYGPGNFPYEHGRSWRAAYIPRAGPMAFRTANGCGPLTGACDGLFGVRGDARQVHAYLAAYQYQRASTQ
jgi:hypothetical protein